MLKKICSRLWRILLAALAVIFPSSCLVTVMYGAPIDTYFNFNTRDTNDTPIEGLELTVSNETELLTTLMSDSNGNAQFSYYYGDSWGTVTINGSSNLTLTVSDIDGVGNGGWFAAYVTNINVSNDDYVLTMQRISN